MKPLLVGIGLLIAVMGVVFALQGADLLPTTIMRGVPWILIGSGVAAAGVGLLGYGIVRG